MATVVADFLRVVMSVALASVLTISMSLIDSMAVVFPAPTGPVKIILWSILAIGTSRQADFNPAAI
jgi:hypothetical protein